MSLSFLSSKKLENSFCLFLFFLGIIHWIFFFNYGRVSFKAYDWPKEFAYYSVLQKSLITYRIPYNISQKFQHTNRFLAIPETALSPQIILLRFMNIDKFILVNTLLLYSVGFIACLLIKKRHQLSFYSFAILFLLFNFNGHITSHLAVGHSMWVGYFLLPFFCLFILELIEDSGTRHGARGTEELPIVDCRLSIENSNKQCTDAKFCVSTNNRIAIKISFVLFAIILQGAFHLYIWCLMFLLLLLIFNSEYRKKCALAILFSLILASFRLFPAMISFWNKRHVFISGYPEIVTFLKSLVIIEQHTSKIAGAVWWKRMGWWEYDLYMSIIGFAMIVYFGIYLRFSKIDYLKNYKYTSLDFPLLIMMLMALSYCYAIIAKLPIPLLNSERVSTRFIIIPIVMLIVISSIRLQKMLSNVEKSLFQIISLITGVIIIAVLLVRHSYVWSIFKIEEHFKNQSVDLSVPFIINQNDMLYKSVVNVSAIVSIVVFAILICLFFRFRFYHGKSGISL